MSDQSPERVEEAWMTPFDGSGVEWHEGLPNPYTYQASDFSKLVAAVHEYEAALREAQAENERLREALDRARRDFNLLSTRLTVAGLNNVSLSIDNAVARIEATLAVPPPADIEPYAPNDFRIQRHPSAPADKAKR